MLSARQLFGLIGKWSERKVSLYCLINDGPKYIIASNHISIQFN
jgi:hypothetical protein